MDGGSGELLVSLVPPNPVKMSQGSTWAGPGTWSQVSFTIPNNPVFVGMKVYTQGYMIDVTASSARVRLGEALELTIR